MKVVSGMIREARCTRKNIFFQCLLFLTLGIGSAQEGPVLHSGVDTTQIKIGEQIKFRVTVETDSTAQVIFPEGQTFSPLETVEAFKTDTTRNKDRITLQKIYALTQFDSGSYTLPAQRIEINGKGYFTDSVRIGVATVPVDTLSQNMFDIKPLIPVDKSRADLWITLLWVVLGLLVAGGLAYWFLFRKKPLTPAEKEALLPPYDRALMELKRLENSKYLIQDEYKKYYSELTDIVRSYLEEEVHVTALESTTDQLIEKLELLKDAGELNLEEDTILQFKKILETADLVKFARSKPSSAVAEGDRKSLETIVIKTKEALPEPKEEDLMQQEVYRAEIARKKQRRKVYLAAASILAFLVLSTALAVAYFGFTYVKDSVLGNPTKTLLEGEWINSSYGYPPINLETPQVLLREETPIPPEAAGKIKESQSFRYTNPEGLFSVGVTSTTFAQPEEPNYDVAVDGLLKQFEKNGARNIITKQEEFTTIGGVKGIKVYGSGSFSVPDSNELVKGQYAILLFGGNGFQQQLVVSWMDGDTYSQEMVARILRSVDVKTQV